MSRTLYELDDEMQRLLEAIEFLDEDDAGIAAVIEGHLSRLQGDINKKLDNYASLICEFDTRSALRKQQAERLAHRAKIDASKSSRLKERLLFWFQVNGRKVVETDQYRITLARNGGQQPITLTVPVEELPTDYLLETVTIKPDLEAIRQALEAGKCVPGAELGERGCNIRIM